MKPSRFFYPQRIAIIVGLAALSASICIGCSSERTTNPTITSKSPATTSETPTTETQHEPVDKDPENPSNIEDTQSESSNPRSQDTDPDHQLAATEDQHDPAKEQEPELFKDWVEPQLVFCFTGRQDGYIEPCGCTGLENQKGGLARRYTMLSELRAKGWPVVPMDVGNQIRRFGRQAEIKFQRSVDGLKAMKYRAISFGANDLRMSVDELFATVVSEEGDSPFVCANVAIFDESFIPKFQVLTFGDLKIGVTAVLDDKIVSKLRSEDILTKTIDEGLRAVWPKLDAANCDINVLLAHADLETSKAIAKKFPNFDLVVSSGDASEPSRTIEKIPETKSLLVQVGTKGMYVAAVGLFDGGDTRFRYERVPLTHKYKDSREMRQLMAAYQEQLKTRGLAGLGVKPLPPPTERRYVGSEACMGCHSDEYDIWKETPHGHATDSLANPGERSDIARHFDPECLSCHVTGWNPQKFYPYSSGYLGLEKTPGMMQSGCENCHGPGSVHVAHQNGDIELSEAESMKVRKDLTLMEKAEQKCLECHDLDNSPGFHEKGGFKDYWLKIKHGKDPY